MTNAKNPRNLRKNILLCDQWIELLDELNIGAFTVNSHGKISTVNYTAQALIGLKMEEMLGKDCREVFVGVPCMVNCMLSGTKYIETGEPDIEIEDEDNRKLLLTRLAAPVYDANQNVTGCMTLLHDQSPIADLIDRIHHEERGLKIILDSLDVGIFTVNRGGYITFFNKEAEKMSGYNRHHVLGKSYTVIFEEHESGDSNLMKKSVTNGSSRSSRHVSMTTRNGESVPVRMNYMALKNEKENIVGGLATFHDLTLVHQLNQAMQDRYTFHDMIGKSPVMQKIFEKVSVVAETDATVLVEGSTGTGKDILAKVIHSSSRRSQLPFIKVNCAAIPDNLLESEMFGYVKGAFTGAVRDKPGRFNEADRGTIFLDEIGDLSIPLQAKLLRVLEDKEFYPLGSRHTQKVDVRIISATNRNLKHLVKKQLFREDLYYRLNLFRFILPDLRERRTDLPLLIRHILRRLCAVNDNRLVEISKSAMEVLLKLDYPGNVRELENIIEHALIICSDNVIQIKHFPDYVQDPPAITAVEESSTTSNNFDSDNSEYHKIRQMLHRYSGHRIKTAKALGMSRITLWRKMKKYGL